jgi:hypothetical protein
MTAEINDRFMIDRMQLIVQFLIVLCYQICSELCDNCAYCTNRFSECAAYLFMTACHLTNKQARSQKFTAGGKTRAMGGI